MLRHRRIFAVLFRGFVVILLCGNRQAIPGVLTPVRHVVQHRSRGFSELERLRYYRHCVAIKPTIAPDNNSSTRDNCHDSRRPYGKAHGKVSSSEKCRCWTASARSKPGQS